MRALTNPPRRTGRKRIQAVVWAGRGDAWRKAKNYAELESNRLLSAVFATATGAFRIRCSGATLEIYLLGGDERLRGSLLLRLPHGRRSTRRRKGRPRT